MKTINPKPFVLALSFFFAGTVMFAQQVYPQKSGDQLSDLQTIKAYNDYVKKLNWNELSSEFKTALEEKYNVLIAAMDREFHHAPDKPDIVKVQLPCIYSFVDTNAYTGKDQNKTHFLYKQH